MAHKLNQTEQRVLEQCFIFCGVENKTGVAEEFGNKQKFLKGSIIYSPNCYQKSMGILLRGTASVEKNNGALLLNTLKPASCFGVAALFAPVRQYVTTVRAKTNCTVLFFSGEALEELFQRQPAICRNYISFLSSRIQFLNKKIDSFTADSPEKKLLLYLGEQIPGENGAILLGLPWVKLAESLDMSRSSLYRAFDALEQQGILRRQGRSIVVLNQQALGPVV